MIIDTPPRLIFFTELASEPLVQLLARPGLVDILAAQGYGVAMAMLDFDDLRAELVRRLTRRGIKVTAWLLLPPDAGYWFNVENYPQAVERYHMLRDWARELDLPFVAVGLDMEPPLPERIDPRYLHTPAIISRLMAARSNALFPAAQEAYLQLVAEIRFDGYAVHTYQYPFVVDDRRAATTLVQRTLNVVDLPADVEVLMCYSSMVPRNLFGSDLGGALVATYGLHADSIGIGSTGGGVVLDQRTGAQAPRLSWAALERDLRIAAQYTDLIHIFSLEGCIAAGYFDRLIAFDWSPVPRIARRHRLAMGGIRWFVGVVLWWSHFGLTLLGWLGWVVAGGMLLRRALARRRRSS